MTQGNEPERLEHQGADGEEYDSKIWDRLKATADPESFSSAWLEQQCQLMGNVIQGIVVYGFPNRGPFAPVAIWPVGSSGNPDLAKATENAISSRQLILQKVKKENDTSHDIIAYPLIVDNKICGAIALEIETDSEDALKKSLGQLEWGSSWLENLVRRNKFAPSDRLITVLELVATGLHNERFQGSATAVATELAGVLQCERVGIGFLRGQHSQLKALSHSASFAKKANIIRAIEACMDEAIDQQTTVVYPAADDAPMQVIKAHEQLAKQYGAGAICTIPFTEGDKIIGAMTLERPENDSFDGRAIQLSEHAATLLGPLLDIKRKDDRWLITKAWDSLKYHVKRLVGPRNVGFKLSTIATVAVIAFFTFSMSDFRVTADAILEGTVQRVVAAPMAGYVVKANVRAGDIVKQGDVLFSLDDRDLRLEHLKWISQKSQRTREFSEAQAKHDRAKARILSAQIEQADAQIALIQEQLNRVDVKAPFDGFVVTGDLSQSLGAPVERGDALFQVAPLNDYRVILKVDEREIGYMKGNETGVLALTGMPDDKIDITIEKITPVSTAEEGNNFFEVEARLSGEVSSKLRPGMEGVGKVFIGRRKTIWVWTHKITHWFRMFFWSWLP